MESVLRDEVLLVESRRHLDVRRGGESLRDAINGNEKIKMKIQIPIWTIIQNLKDMIVACIVRRSICWQNLWTKFHKFRQCELLQIWGKIGDAVGIECDPILVQSTTERLLTELSRMQVGRAVSSTKLREPRKFSFVEECAILYCGGFVVNKLLKKYTTDGGEIAASFVQVLLSMCNMHFYDEECSDFEEYIKNGLLMLIEGD